MVLSCSFLTDVGGVNSFRESSAISMSEGDTLTVYLKLVDISVNTASEGFKPVGRRYIPATGATLKVSIDNSFDDSKLVTKIANQPFSSQDPSIWSFTIQTTDRVLGAKNIRLELNESSKITKGIVQGGIRVYPVTTVTP
jgi:hypothetical protein